MFKTILIVLVLIVISSFCFAQTNGMLLGVYGYELDEIDGVALPSDFYTYDLESQDGRAPGNIFATAISYSFELGRNKGFQFVMNNDNEIIYYYRYLALPRGENLTPFPEEGKLAYAMGGVRYPDKWIILDQTMTVIDSIVGSEDYELDGHEILITNEGHYWVEIFDPRIMDMSQYVEGGHVDCEVNGHTIQELDADKDVIWEWRSLDYLDELPFSDMDDQDRLLQEEFEHLHTNSIAIANDGNVIISNRTMSEVIKINYDTHDIMWRLGGGSGNQFTFEGDFDIPLDFKAQHDFTQLPNGNYTLYDNGNGHNPQASYAKEYQLDEDNLIATLVWAFESDPPEFGPFTGGTRRLDNGNTLISWGARSTSSASEVTPDGNTVWRMAFHMDPYTQFTPFSYRFYKADMDITSSLPYICETVEDNDVTLCLNYFGHEEETESYNIYMDTTPEPETLLQNSTSNQFMIEDLPYLTDYYIRIAAVDGDGVESAYSNEIHLNIEENSVDEPDHSIPEAFALEQNWPNPFNSTTMIRINLRESNTMKISVFDILGREISSLHEGNLSAGSHDFVFSGEQLVSGIYFVKAEAANQLTAVQKMILLK